MHQSILSFRRSRYLWWSSTMCIAAIVAYYMHDPAMPPNGGTWLGYTLGTVGAVLILWLMWFGIRKRRYRSRMGTVHGWLSAHIYLGLGLITVVTLHTGFQFGWNLHTLTYLLMMLVIVSGLVGVYCYLHFPRVMTEDAGESTADSLIRQIQEIDRQALILASEIDPQTHDKVIKSIQRSSIGGNPWQLLFARGKTRAIEGLSEAPQQSAKSSADDTFVGGGSTMMFMASNIASGRLDKGDAMRRLSDLLIGHKTGLVKQLRRNLQVKAFLDLWLYFHVPLSFALLAALIAHIVSVFFYW
jgi:hypothetical protein